MILQTYMDKSSSSSPSSALLRHPLSSPLTRPQADDLAVTWILEFVLRQTLPDSLAHEIFFSLPLSSSDLHPHLRKTLLIRRIASELQRCCLSECTLHALELIAELDRQRGVAPSHRLKSAYCAVSVECAVLAFRRNGRDFSDAVESFFMEEEAGGLGSELLVEWGKKIKLCLSSGEGCEEILKRDAQDALMLVRDYLNEALEEMGPSFLEMAAAEFVEKRRTLDVAPDKEEGKSAAVLNGFFEKLDENGEFKDGGVSISLGTVEKDGLPERLISIPDASGNNLRVGMLREEFNGQDEASTKQYGDFQENNEKADKVGGHEMPHHCGSKIHQVDPGEVCKVKDALKKSCFDLKMAVEDPLPEAQAVAAAVLASLSHDQLLFHENAKQSFVEASTRANLSTGELEKEGLVIGRNSSNMNQVEGNHIVKACNMNAGPSKNRGNVACQYLFEKNSTAHTREWSDDSIESPVSMEKLQYLNPMKRRISLTRLDDGKCVKRRVVKRWTSEEEHVLREAVAKYGRGNWKLIRNCHPVIFEERTEVDLKDKWRNMTRHLL